ncbi:MAG TPA: response regulator transcription factor [Burkholderiaceae bacterium]
MRKFNVLLADDHAIIRDGLKQILADTEDLEVGGEAANGIEVMQRVRERDWDVIVLDISMPGRNGLELIRMIREEKSNQRILIFSMHNEEQYASRALAAGAAGYLTKESDSDVLVAAIRRVAGGGMHVSNKVAEMIVRDIHPADKPAPHRQLSNREYQVFNLLVDGRGITEIANELCLSVKTVSTHKTHIFHKLSLGNFAELIRYAITHQLTLPTEF